MSESEEKLPISEKLAVIESKTIYKTGKWWLAVALVDSFGRKQVATYLWVNRGGNWKRQHKMLVHNKKEWSQLKEAIEKFAEQLS